MSWVLYEEGRTQNTRGSENGIIVRDEEHPAGARITLERDGDNAPFAITCGMYGWFFHTRFIATHEEAEASYVAMKADISALLRSISLQSDAPSVDKMSEVYEAISTFVDRYP